jgi:hypothetical protein
MGPEVLIGPIGDPITGVAPAYASVHNSIGRRNGQVCLLRDLVPVVGAGWKRERSCRAGGGDRGVRGATLAEETRREEKKARREEGWRVCV